jgi:Ni/Co efflux regulator RcnB
MTRFLPIALLMLAVALPVTASADAGSDYQRYAQVRERVQHCVLDRQWGQLSATERKSCKKLRKLYTVWTQPGESSDFHLHCLTSKCPPSINGEPDPRAAIPSGAKNYKP